MKRILTYHKAGIQFDSSICWVDHYSFIQHMDFLLGSDYNLTTIRGNSGGNNLSIIFDDGYKHIFRYRDLFTLKRITTTIFPITAYFDRYDYWDVPLMGVRFKHLSKEQLKILSDDGHEIGSHTHTHPDLTSISKERLIDELDRSKKIVEDITGVECSTLSTPFGRVDQRVRDLALNLGYREIIYLGKRLALDGCSKSKQVYFFDGINGLKRKLDPKDRYFMLEELKLDLINFFNRGTIIVKRLFDRGDL